LSIAFCYDDTLDSSDGVVQNIKTLGKWLIRHGHQVTYLVGSSKSRSWAGADVHSLAKNLRISWNGNRLSMPVYPLLKNINQVIAANDFDVLHVQMPYSPFMAQRVINRIGSNTAVVGTAHVVPASSWSQAGSKLLKTLYGKSLRRFDIVASVSPVAQHYTKQAFGIESLVIPNPVDVAGFRQTIGKNQKKKIIFLGRLVKRKGCRFMIKAFAKVAQSQPETTLIIAGDGPEHRSLKSLVNRLGIADRVQFLGFVPESAKPKLLASADIACFPSLYGESFGIVLIEAMAAGAGVVIGGDNPGYRTVLGDENTLINPRNTDLFASQLKKLLNEEMLAAKIHSSQQAKVSQYDIETIGPHWLKIYLQAIAKRSAKRHN